MQPSPTIHLVIMGVSGSGKTTVAELVAAELGWPLAEADEFHPQANIDKMTQGVALTDEDRKPWLEAIRAWMDQSGQDTVVTCSALKRSYRDILRGAKGVVIFAHLDGDPELIKERMEHRSGHFMPPSLLPSQLSTLEALDPDERAVRVDIAHSPKQLAQEIVDFVDSVRADIANIADRPDRPESGE